MTLDIAKTHNSNNQPTKDSELGQYSNELGRYSNELGQYSNIY